MMLVRAPWSIGSSELPWWRRAVVAAAAVLAVGAWNHGAAVVSLAIVGAPVALMHLDRTWAQVAARAALVATLLHGLLPAAKPLGAPAAALALVALGAAGLGERRHDRFRPASHRRLLQGLLVLGGAQLILLTVRLSHRWPELSPWILDHPRRAAFELTLVVFSALAGVGMYRLRVWGLFAQAVASVGLLVLTLVGRHRLGGIVWLPLEPRAWFPLTFASTLLVAILLARILDSARRGRPPDGLVRW